MSNPRFALISPTFKRPEEVTEFLQSLVELDFPQEKFEIILGDGTPGDELRPLLVPFLSKLPLEIYYQEFLPVSDARNRAAELSSADFFIFLDSDCIIPSGYLKSIESFLDTHKEVTLFGGPDAASEDFTDLQKAISFSMTSFLTTGGIRGGKSALTVYHPRGFNMGIHSELFKSVGGYDENFICGEDVELSIRLIAQGAKSAFIEPAHVYHKRRTSISQFRRQVFRFGAARPLLAQAHAGNLKITHLFPVLFTMYRWMSLLLVVSYLYSGLLWTLLPFVGYIAYMSTVFIAALLKENLSVALLVMKTTTTMNAGYGWGFARNFWEVFVRGNSKGIQL